MTALNTYLLLSLGNLFSVAALFPIIKYTYKRIHA